MNDLRPAPGLEHRDLPFLVDEGLESVARGGSQFFIVLDALEQDDARLAARLPQRQRLLDPGDAKGIRRRERLGCREQAVSVGVRLDDRDDAAAWG